MKTVFDSEPVSVHEPISSERMRSSFGVFFFFFFFTEFMVTLVFTTHFVILRSKGKKNKRFIKSYGTADCTLSSQKVT